MKTTKPCARATKRRSSRETKVWLWTTRDLKRLGKMMKCDDHRDDSSCFQAGDKTAEGGGDEEPENKVCIFSVQ